MKSTLAEKGRMQMMCCLPSYAGHGSKIGAVASVDERVEL
jgi:hypothetical protein